MRVNLNQLYVFYLAARGKSMASAAKALFVSPPAVTMQIKKLENLLGFSVFERSRGKLRTTERGRALYAIIEPTFRNFDELGRSIHALTQAEGGAIRLGTHHLPAQHLLPDLIAHVQTKHPKITVQMELGTQDGLLEKLLRQELDLALIIEEPALSAKHGLVHLFDEEWVLVVAAESDLAAIDTLSVKDLGAIPLILQQKGTGALQVVLDFLKRHDARPDILLSNISSDVIKQFLPKMRAGAFIGRFIVEKELREGLFHEIRIREGSPICRFFLAYKDGSPLSPNIADFLKEAADFSPGSGNLGQTAGSPPPP